MAAPALEGVAVTALRAVLHRVRVAAEKSGRLADDVRVVAVSKTKPVSLIDQVYDAGHRCFGENYVQEIIEKAPQLPEDIEWHFVGHLQSNKVKPLLTAVPNLAMVHGVDNVKILVQHIKTLLPGLKSRISAALVSVAKEHASYGEITESKAGMGALLLNILSKYSDAFSSMIEGKNEEMSTSELSGGARIHYIFQSIFVKSLEEVDPCEDLTDDDIRTAIQNATGPRSALFVPEVPFEVLIRRQIARLLDPSLQCARFIYDELIKMSHRCMVNELHRFPVLRRRMDEVIGNFLREGLEPSETVIGHIVEMEDFRWMNINCKIAS